MKPGTMKINHIMAILATIGGISAAFTNHAERNHLYPVWKFKTSRTESEKVQFISAHHLADLVYQKEPGLTILDIRSEEAYREYHIPGAIHLTESETLSELGSPEKVIVCGEDISKNLNEFIQETAGKKYIIKGGLEEWYRIVLFPDFSKMQVRNRQTLDLIINRSRYFGGEPKNTQHLNITLRSSQFREGC